MFLSRRTSFSIIIFLALLMSFPGFVMADSKSNYTLIIDRKVRTFYVLNDKNKIIRQFPCGIGKGGLKKKKNMSDMITPMGDFVVDIILYKDKQYANIADSAQKRFGSGEYKDFVKDKEGLSKLFENMNSIDFDKNGIPDSAYGIAYIGLDSKNAVTGPKMHTYNDIPYWYSIAVHGTNDPLNIGQARSGGCIHLNEEDLVWLIENKIVTIGSNLEIRDQGPKETYGKKEKGVIAWRDYH